MGRGDTDHGWGHTMAVGRVLGWVEGASVVCVGANRACLQIT